MCLMATLTIGCAHIDTVRLMALGALRNLAMNVVAEAAGQLGVLAGELLQLDDLRTMASEAFVGDIVGQLDVFRCMRVVMAALTVGQLVVRFVAVAHAALWNYILRYCRGMANMAILTGNIGFMRSTFCLDIGRGCNMAFDTIRIAQSNFRLGRLCAKSGDRQQARRRNRQQQTSQG